MEICLVYQFPFIESARKTSSVLSNREFHHSLTLFYGGIIERDSEIFPNHSCLT